MVRIPIGNEKSARIEIRSIAPDANPYLALYAALRTGLEGPKSAENDSKRERTRFLPDNIYDAIRLFKGSKFMEDLLGAEVHERYIALKTDAGGPLPEGAGLAHQDVRSAVPPRGDEPVPVESVLTLVG